MTLDRAHGEHEAFAENYPALVTVKAKYDPHNVFHNPQSIPPRMHQVKQ